MTGESLRALLRTQYGLATRALTFLPIGSDPQSSVYRLDAADGNAYFVKRRAGDGFRPSSLEIPAFLADAGVPHLIPPLRTQSGTHWVTDGDAAVFLYPFAPARPAAAVGLTGAQWSDLGTAIRQIHARTLPAPLHSALRVESYVPSRRPVIDQIGAALPEMARGDPIAQALARFWSSRQEVIDLVVARGDRLGPALRQSRRPLVLCHADLHLWNIVVDESQEWWIVDWDEIVMAPKERDLMFVIGGIGHGLVRADETARFLEGYGEPEIDPLGLAYYRFAWAAADIAAYAEEAVLTPGLSDAVRRDALAGLQATFAPGNIVDIALGTDLGAL